MATERFGAERLRAVLERDRIATLEQLKDGLGTKATMTVFRKLKDLGYLSSYSHCGRYYTLSGIPQFDERGLWGHQAVWFSRHGNLVETARVLVERAECGFTASELEGVVHVECKRALRTLSQDRRLAREPMSGVLVYLSADRGKRRRQKQVREQVSGQPESGLPLSPATFSHEWKAGLVLFFSLLDEKQRRLYAGLESYRLGHGGDRTIADLLDLDVHTVARGRRELLRGEVERGIRRQGGGRKAVEKKHRTS